MATQERERWRNAIPGTVAVKTFDVRGQLKHTVVASGRTIDLTPEERRINQEEAAQEDLDVFTNGVLEPVKLLDSEHDTEALRTNPQLISEADIEELFDSSKTHYRAFDQRVAQITNPYTLNRLMEVAKERDATKRQFDVLEARLAEVAPRGFAEVDQVPEDSPEPRTEPKPVTLR